MKHKNKKTSQIQKTAKKAANWLRAYSEEREPRRSIANDEAQDLANELETAINDLRQQ